MSKTLRDDKGRYAGSVPSGHQSAPPISSDIPAITVPSSDIPEQPTVTDMYASFRKRMNWASNSSVEQNQQDFIDEVVARYAKSSDPDRVEEGRDLIDQGLQEHRVSRYRPGSRDYDPSEYLDVVREGLEMLGVPRSESDDIAYKMVGDDMGAWTGPR